MCTTISFSRLTKKGNRIEYRETPSKRILEIRINDDLAREWGYANLQSFLPKNIGIDLIGEWLEVPVSPNYWTVNKLKLKYWQIRSLFIYYREWFKVKVLKR